MREGRESQGYRPLCIFNMCFGQGLYARMNRNVCGGEHLSLNIILNRFYTYCIHKDSYNQEQFNHV